MDWLKDRYRFRHDDAAALALAEKLFRAHPEIGRYRELDELGRRLGRWDAMRPGLLSFLRGQGHDYLLITIYLEEGEIGDALKALHAVGSRPIYGAYGQEPLAIRVARAAEATHPREAIEIYREAVEHRIAMRSRPNYAEAARFIARMREVYVSLGESDTFSDYLADLRDRHRTLRALKEELIGAGL